MSFAINKYKESKKIHKKILSKFLIAKQFKVCIRLNKLSLKDLSLK